MRHMQSELSPSDNAAAAQEARVRQGGDLRLRPLQRTLQAQAQPAEASQGPPGWPEPRPGGRRSARRRRRLRMAHAQLHLTEERRESRLERLAGKAAVANKS